MAKKNNNMNIKNNETVVEDIEEKVETIKTEIKTKDADNVKVLNFGNRTFILSSGKFKPQEIKTISKKEYDNIKVFGGLRVL